MPFLHVPVTQEQLDHLAEHARACSQSRAGAVRSWLDSLDTDLQALPRATQPQAAATTTDAEILPEDEAVKEVEVIGFQAAPDPVAEAIRALRNEDAWARQ